MNGKQVKIYLGGQFEKHKSTTSLKPTKAMLKVRNFCWPEVVYGWAPIRRTRLGRPNNSKQRATWEATEAFKLFWSSVFLVLSVLGLILLILILLHLCCRFRISEVVVAKEI